MTTPSPPLARLSGTALIIARARAAETRRPDHLFEDHLAQQFLDTAGPDHETAWNTEQGQLFTDAMGDYFALRTRYFDDYLDRAAAAGCRQVVLLAAGLDTRAHRLHWPSGTRLFELDQPDVLAFKEHALRGRAPRCHREAIVADLRQDWAEPLAAHGFRADLPTAWLIEGLLVYLTEQDADGLLERVTALSAPGSHLAIEHTTRGMINTDQAQQAAAAAPDSIVDQLSTLWKNNMTRPPGDWLASHGWHSTQESLTHLAQHHNRPVPPAFNPELPGTGRITLLSASR
ncbi:SAM-dependent methyltransferase [Streptomyces sp. NPDC059788]|uniref:SAM-dependent methyltransferase n=1 Tax=Streptomyces sp. NPDC059788 TaxID=3346948 RepID=UPI00364BF007